MAKHVACKTFEESSIDHPANGILLCADVQRCLDAHDFVFYPNSGHVAGPGAQAGADNDNLDASKETFVAYFVGEGYLHLPDLFHRRRVAVHPQV